MRGEKVLLTKCEKLEALGEQRDFTAPIILGNRTTLKFLLLEFCEKPNEL